MEEGCREICLEAVTTAKNNFKNTEDDSKGNIVHIFLSLQLEDSPVAYDKG